MNNKDDIEVNQNKSVKAILKENGVHEEHLSIYRDRKTRTGHLHKKETINITSKACNIPLDDRSYTLPLSFYTTRLIVNCINFCQKFHTWLENILLLKCIMKNLERTV